MTKGLDYKQAYGGSNILVSKIDQMLIEHK